MPSAAVTLPSAMPTYVTAIDQDSVDTDATQSRVPAKMGTSSHGGSIGMRRTFTRIPPSARSVSPAWRAPRRRGCRTAPIDSAGPARTARVLRRPPPTWRRLHSQSESATGRSPRGIAGTGPRSPRRSPFLQRADVAAAELAPDEAAQLQVGQVLEHLVRGCSVGRELGEAPVAALDRVEQLPQPRLDRDGGRCRWVGGAPVGRPEQLVEDVAGVADDGSAGSEQGVGAGREARRDQ